MEYLQESQPSLFPKSVQTQAVLSRHPITAPLEWTLLLGAALIKLNADLSTLSFLNYFPAYSADPLLLNREDYRGGGWVRGGGVKHVTEVGSDGRPVQTELSHKG